MAVVLTFSHCSDHIGYALLHFQDWSAGWRELDGIGSSSVFQWRNRRATHSDSGISPPWSQLITTFWLLFFGVFGIGIRPHRQLAWWLLSKPCCLPFSACSKVNTVAGSVADRICVQNQEAPLEALSEYPSESIKARVSWGSRLDSQLFRPFARSRIGSHVNTAVTSQRNWGSTSGHSISMFSSSASGCTIEWLTTVVGEIMCFSFSAKWRYQIPRVSKKVRWWASFWCNCWAFGPFTKILLVFVCRSDPVWVRFMQCLLMSGKVSLAFLPQRWWMCHWRFCVGNARNWPERIQILRICQGRIQFFGYISPEFNHFLPWLRAKLVLYCQLADNPWFCESAPALNECTKNLLIQTIRKPFWKHSIYLIASFSGKKLLDALDSKIPMFWVISTALAGQGRDHFFSRVQNNFPNWNFLRGFLLPQKARSVFRCRQVLGVWVFWTCVNECWGDFKEENHVLWMVMVLKVRNEGVDWKIERFERF